MRSRSVVLLLLISMVAFGQDSLPRGSKFVVKPAYIPGMTPYKTRGSLRNADSMNAEINSLRAQNDSLQLRINEETSRVQSISEELTKSNEKIENLNQELEESKGNQLQTSHTSSILLIFNIIAGIILLITIFWFYSRKKTNEPDEDEVVRPVKTVQMNGRDQVETRLERIEKLGKLRDKGLLTEEEFQLQKKQILE